MECHWRTALHATLFQNVVFFKTVCTTYFGQYGHNHVVTYSPAEIAVLTWSHSMCGPMYVLLVGRCPCVWLCSYDCQSHVCAGVALGDGPVSLCVAVFLWLPVPCMCWCSPRLWTGALVCNSVPVTASPMYVLVYPSVMDRCPYVWLFCYDCQPLICAGVSLGDGPVSLCVAVFLWLSVPCKCCWWPGVPVCGCVPMTASPMYVLVYLSVMDQCPCVWLCSYYCQSHVCAGVSLSDGPVSLCVAVLLWLSVPYMCWCILQCWTGVPVCSCVPMNSSHMYVLVYNSEMDRCPCVWMCWYDCQFHVCAAGGPVSLCVAMFLISSPIHMLMYPTWGTVFSRVASVYKQNFEIHPIANNVQEDAAIKNSANDSTTSLHLLYKANKYNLSYFSTFVG
jgi:hypothetical protein